MWSLEVTLLENKTQTLKLSGLLNPPETADPRSDRQNVERSTRQGNQIEGRLQEMAAVDSAQMQACQFAGSQLSCPRRNVVLLEDKKSFLAPQRLPCLFQDCQVCDFDRVFVLGGSLSQL